MLRKNPPASRARSGRLRFHRRQARQSRNWMSPTIARNRPSPTMPFSAASSKYMLWARRSTVM